MTMAAARTEDRELLRRFADERAEDAFAELVTRHIGLVHSAALRQVGGNTASAADVTQAVFTEVARQAGRLSQHPALVGWLYTTTHRMAACHVRSETRRQRREQEAYAMQELHRDPEPSPDWPRLRPVIDSAMHDLPEADRIAVLLRHFEQRSFTEVGVRLGLSENAARMRVDRALEKLRTKLAKRGVTSTGSALAVALTGQAVTAVPTTLAATITTAALAAGVATTSAWGLLSFMASSKLKLAGAVALAATITTSLVVQQRSLQLQRAENAQIRERLAQTVNQPGPSVSAAVGDNGELARLRAEHNELLRLRGEVGRLRSEAARSGQLAARPQPRPVGRSEAPGLVGGYQLFESNPLSEHHVDAIKTMKLVGRELHRLAQGADSLAAETRTAPLVADGQPAKVLMQSLASPPPDWGQFEFAEFEVLVPDLVTLKQLMDSGSGAIITRTKNEIPTPDGRFVRIYGKADGSVLNLVHDASTKALEFGDTPSLPP